MTRQQLICEKLKKMEWIEEFGRSRKYRVFGKPDKQRKYFVGRAGAVRWGTCISKSISMTDRINWKALTKEVESYDQEVQQKS